MKMGWRTQPIGSGFKKGSIVEKPAKTLRLALANWPFGESLTPDLEENDFESPVRQELAALTKSGKTPGVRLSTVVTPT